MSLSGLLDSRPFSLSNEARTLASFKRFKDIGSVTPSSHRLSALSLVGDKDTARIFLIRSDMLKSAYDEDINDGSSAPNTGLLPGDAGVVGTGGECFASEGIAVNFWFNDARSGVSPPDCKTGPVAAREGVFARFLMGMSIVLRRLLSPLLEIVCVTAG